MRTWSPHWHLQKQQQQTVTVTLVCCCCCCSCWVQTKDLELKLVRSAWVLRLRACCGNSAAGATPTHSWLRCKRCCCCAAAAAAARVLFQFVFWARALQVFLLLLLLQLCAHIPIEHGAGHWGEGRGRTISYYIKYQLNRSIICKLPEHIKFEQRHTHSNTLTHINTLIHTLTHSYTHTYNAVLDFVA